MIKKTALVIILLGFLTLGFALTQVTLAQEETETNQPARTREVVEVAEEATITPYIEPEPVAAPEQQGGLSSLITISPPVRELELPRGSANSYQMSLLNQSDRTVTLVLRASPFIASGDTGGVEVDDDPLPDSHNWVVINPNRVTLEAGEQVDVAYTIVIPQNAEPGGFYFAVTALLSGETDLVGQTDQITTGAFVNLNVASLNLVTVEGPVEYSANITEFSTPRVLFEYGPVPFVARILNLSTVHIKPILEIEVRNTWGLEQPSLVRLERQNILPQAQRQYEAEFGGRWHFGRYSATLSALYGDGQTITHTLFFWVMPWKIILAVLLALAIVILLILSIKRQLDEKKVLEEELRQIRTPEQKG